MKNDDERPRLPHTGSERVFTRIELDKGTFPHELIIPVRGLSQRSVHWLPQQSTDFEATCVLITEETFKTLIRTARRAMQNRDRLLKYAQHLPTCPNSVGRIIGELSKEGPLACTCGLEKEFAYFAEDRK